MIDWSLRVPWGYSTSYKTLAEVRDILAVHYHPEYLRRLLAWLSEQDGQIGVGGHWRAGGAQPDKPGFAPEGKSFHQDQNYRDGFTGACAVDLVAANPGQVHRAPRWDEVPAQGSAEAKAWGVHCNIGTPGAYGSEPWHMQPVEIDGWQSWWDAGRPAPVAGYPLPTDPTEPDLPPEENMAKLAIIRPRTYGNQYVLLPIASAEQARRMGMEGQPPVVIDLTPAQVAELEAAQGHKLTPTVSGD